MARLNVAAAGNAEENINLINARFQAEALRRIRGVDCGVLDNSFYSGTDNTALSRTANANFMWKLTASNVQNITVGRGMATAYGFDIQSEADVSFTATAPSAGTKYLFVYLEWDLSNPVEAVGSIKIQDNGSGSSWTPPSQDNLITNPIGKYQMPLYRLAVNTSGTVTGTQDWSALGVRTIGNPRRADYATRANDSDRADYASGDTTGKTIAENTSSILSRLDALGFRTGSITLPNGSATVNKVDRQGNYCILTLKVDYPKTTGGQSSPTGIQRTSGDEYTSTWDNFQIPANLRPKNDMSFNAAAYLAGPGYGNYVGSWCIVNCTITAAGKLTIKLSGGGYYTSHLQTIDLYIGYEAPAIAV